MEANRSLVKILSYILIGSGLILLPLNFILGGKANIALPLVFLTLSGVFFILAIAFTSQKPWGDLLYIPGALLLSFGVVFLLNVLTNDWNAWAYAWLLLVAGVGMGMVLANQHGNWRTQVTLIGWGLIVGGITLFALFGAIAGGIFIQVMAPVLLLLGGLLLYRLRSDRGLIEQVRSLFNLAPGNSGEKPAQPPDSRPDQGGLAEPLTARELDVLRLVDQGLTNPEIAEKLVLAPSTVKTHINNLYSKLGVQTRVQAINQARTLGLLDD
ncbi:MAG: hypothetical protein GYA17_11780 [Chloroflexi bacterium]|jgi:DNA-binding CsgD family transcriptional regulator|nr:hypothetical protein [Chloroflexota bacterium]